MSRWILQFTLFTLMATAVCIVVGRDARADGPSDARSRLKPASDSDGLPERDGARLLPLESMAPLSAVLIKSTLLGLDFYSATFGTTLQSLPVDSSTFEWSSRAVAAIFADENLRLRI